MQKHSLSLCLVFGDDEEAIGRTLKSVLAAVDEVVAVDRGSKDNTRLIVEGYGARVVDTVWTGDESAVRNAGLVAAYSDWILVMEPGEVLELTGPVDLGSLLAERNALGYYLRVIDDQPRTGLRIRDEIRLFRNLSRARYRHRVCERIEPSLSEIARAEGGDFRSSELRLHRPLEAGLSPDAAHRSKLQALRHAVNEMPSEPWYRYCLARESVMSEGGEILPVKGFSRLLRSVEEAYALVEEEGEEKAMQLVWGQELSALLAQARRAAGRLEESREAAESGLKRYGESSRLRFEQAVSILSIEAAKKTRPGKARKKDRAKAVESLESLLQGPQQIERVELQTGHFHPWARVWLGRAALLEGDLPRARSLFLEALEENPAEAASWCGLAKAAADEGRDRDALQIYLKALNATQMYGPAWLGGIEVLSRLGFTDNAWSWHQRVSMLLPELPGLSRLEQSLATQQQAETAGV